MLRRLCIHMEWQGQFYLFKNSDRNKIRHSTRCFTSPDMTSWTKPVEAIVSHDEKEKKRRKPRI